MEEDKIPQFRFQDIALLIEFACWLIVLLAPVLRLVNGPAVSTDQFVVQVLLVAAALVGAIGLRFYQWFFRL